MARYVASVETLWEREVAFGYLADFANIADWDPGVARARRLSEPALEVGARFEVISSVMGREVPLVYETIEIDPPRRILLRAETSTVVSLDLMSFDLKPGGGTIVTYDADLKLKGPLRLLDLPFRLAFRRLGDNARDGLRRKLAEAS
jgi:Polyketide cyclase / dehydrase and lipid transport